MRLACWHLLHALSGLSGDIDQVDHFKLGLADVQMFVETGSLAPLCHDCQVRLRRTPHEQQDVHMPSFPVQT